MSALLIPEPPLQVLPTLARRIGLNEALLLQQLHYLSLRAEYTAGVQKTHGELLRIFSFWGAATLKRTIVSLRQHGLLNVDIVPLAGGRVNRYRVDHDAVEACMGSRQNELTGHVKLTPGSRQNEPTPLIKGTTERTTEDASHPPSRPQPRRNPERAGQQPGMRYQRCSDDCVERCMGLVHCIDEMVRLNAAAGSDEL